MRDFSSPANQLGFAQKVVHVAAVIGPLQNRNKHSDQERALDRTREDSENSVGPLEGRLVNQCVQFVTDKGESKIDDQEKEEEHESGYPAHLPAGFGDPPGQVLQSLLIHQSKEQACTEAEDDEQFEDESALQARYSEACKQDEDENIEDMHSRRSTFLRRARVPCQAKRCEKRVL